MNKNILKLAIPNIISNISIPLLSGIDTSLMGHISPVYLAAVGTGGMIFNFLYINFGFLRMGTTGITAQAFGRNNKRFAVLTLIRSFIIAIFIFSVILLFQNPIWNLSSYLMNINNTLYDAVKIYFFIRLTALPAGLLLYVCFGWLFGMQNSMMPMIVTIISNILNIIISIYFVKYLNYGIAGVAWGTVVAQYISLIIIVLYIYLKYKKIFIQISFSEIFKRNEFKNLFSINTDIFIRTLLLTFVFFFFYSKSASGGQIVIASTVVLIQFINILSYGIDGFAYASESLAGKYYGAEDFSNLRKSISYSFIWSGAVAILYSFCFLILGTEIILIFTSDTLLIMNIEKMLWIIQILPLIAFQGYIWDGIFIGLTAVKQMRNSMMISTIFFILCYYACLTYFNIHTSLWISLPVFYIMRGGIQTIIYFRKIQFTIQ